MPKGIAKRGPFQRSMKSFAAFAANDRGIGYEFWLFHGINYLSECPFPGIYSGDQIYRGMVFTHMMEKHLDANGVLSERGRQCVVWASALPDELFRAAAYIKAFAHKYERNPLEYGDPYVRVAVEAMAAVMSSAMDGWGESDPPSHRVYYRYPAKYHRNMRRVRLAILDHDPRSRNGWEFWADRHRQTIETYGLPPGVKPFRLEYKERNNGGYLRHTGNLRGHKTKG